MTTCSDPATSDVAGAAVALSAADMHLLGLAAYLPLAPLTVLAPFLSGGMSTAHRRARQLWRRGLLDTVATPLSTEGRPARLYVPTELGLAILAHRRMTEPTVLTCQVAPRRLTPTGLLRELPGLLASYELLALLAATRPGPASLRAWERPWRTTLPPLTTRTGAVSRGVRLPAATTLAWDTPDGTVIRQWLLLPDTGGLALPAVRGTLGRLAEHLAASRAPATLVVATTTPRRVAAWTALLETVGQARHLPLPVAHVATWTELRQVATGRHQPPGPSRRLLATSTRPPGAVPQSAAGEVPLTARASRSGFQSGSISTAASVLRLSPLDCAILDLVGRHPFLPTDTLAAFLDRDTRCARTRRASLVGRGLLRVLPTVEVALPELARAGLLELTRDGLLVLAGQLGLPLAAAVRYHGLAGGGPATPTGPRAALLAHLPHTLGADGVFAVLARRARAHPGGGALLEWRGPASCAHGRQRPDGYGLLRLGNRQRGFFLEFDRGSMRPGQLRAKFAAYHRYRASARAARDHAGFPLILVVTTGPGPERRLAQAIRAVDAGQAARLPALLTTTGLLTSLPNGPLGCVWRTAADPARRLLLP